MLSNMLEDRIFRCEISDFYNNEIESVNETHPDDKLRAIADAGFNGIWLRGIIRELVPTSLFKNYSDTLKAQEALKSLCSRAEKFGLGVWLYFTEPLGLPSSHKFCKENPGVTGPETVIPGLEPDGTLCSSKSLCSSTPEVKEYLKEGFTKIARNIPLRGIILITTSEQVSHCWAHVLSSPESYPDPEKFWSLKCKCPRCAERNASDVITEIIKIISDSVKSARPQTKIVAWDWSWNMHTAPPYKRIVEKLPEGVILMGDFERGGQVERLGKKCMVEEYSLVYPGPSDRFAGEVKLTSASRDMFATLRLNTTHELATVPNLPLIVSLYRKVAYMYEAKIKGVMGCWNFGCFTDTLNIFAFNKFFTSPVSQNLEKEWLKLLAIDYFGKEAGIDLVVDAWYGFQKAVQHYPINGNKFVYFSPTNYALCYPLKSEFTNTQMGISCFRHNWGDRLEDSLGGFELAEVVDLLERLTAEWFEACDLYKQGLSSASNTQHKQIEYGVALTTGCCFHSTYNIYRWYLQRKGRTTKKLNEMDVLIVNDEIENLQMVLPFVKKDKRLGFHQEGNCYMFSSEEINEKLRRLKDLLM